MISNVKTYLQIAREAHLEMLNLVEQGRAPHADGRPGFVITHDPQKRSFKQALIAITFTGIYYEALTYALARQKSMNFAACVGRAVYEKKLVLLGLSDSALMASVAKFREARNDLVHEKAEPINAMDVSKTRTAQTVASEGIALIDAVHKALNVM